jgi:hypothetical protein
MSEQGASARRIPNLQSLLFLLGLALTSLASAPAARAAAPWTLLGVQEGLLDSSIHSLTSTASGEILVGTAQGLSRWDGRRWISYSPGNGLAEGYITAALQVPATLTETTGALWAGSWGGGVSVLRGRQWRRYSTQNSTLPGDWISALAWGQGGVWVATYGGGLAHYRDDRWAIYTRANSGLPSDWLTALLADETTGSLWIGTERAGLAHRSADGQWRYFPLPSGLGDEVTALARRADELWVGTPSGVAVLYLPTSQWQTRDQIQDLPSRRITALVPGRDSTMWIGTEQGLVHWAGGRVQTYTTRDGLPHNACSVLAADGVGRLWVGTFSSGLAVQGQIVLPQIQRPPVILVHGWRGPDSDRLEDSEFWHLARWLHEDGFLSYYATGISPSNSLQTNAAYLQETIGRARQETGAAKVYVIAFSMGGLNARAYLESTLYQDDVLRAFILGTPQRGEELWEPLLLWEYLAWSNEPSTLELMPTVVELFNSVHSNAWGVPYTVIAGDAAQGASGDIPLPTLFRELPPGDGLVSTWSALGPEEQTAERRITQDIHAWSTETLLLGIPSLLLPRTTYDAHIRPFLLGMADAPGTGSQTDVTLPVRPSLEPRTALHGGTIRPSETITLPTVPIEASGRARFYIRWKGPAIRASLADPQGQRIDADKVTDSSQAEYLSLGFADFASYVLTDTLPGPWQVILSSPASNSGPSQYVAYAAIASPVRLQVAVARTWYQPGQEVLLSATLSDTQGLAEISAVNAEIYGPRKNKVATLVFSRAQDGQGILPRYEGAFTPQESGYYTVLVHAVGQQSGFALEREESLLFGVADDSAHFTGQFALQARTALADGQPGLEALVGLSVRRTGDFVLSLTVGDAEGRSAKVAHPVHLSSGEHLLTVALPLTTLAARPLNTRYWLSEVTLLHTSRAPILLDSAQDVAVVDVLTPDDSAQVP